MAYDTEWQRTDRWTVIMVDPSLTNLAAGNKLTFDGTRTSVDLKSTQSTWGSGGSHSQRPGGYPEKVTLTTPPVTITRIPSTNATPTLLICVSCAPEDPTDRFAGATPASVCWTAVEGGGSGGGSPTRPVPPKRPKQLKTKTL